MIATSQPARPPSADLLRRLRRITYEESLLHLGDDLAGDLQLSGDTVEAVRMEPDDRLGDDRRRIELVRNRDPVLAAKAAFREPATDFAPQ